MSDDDDDDCVPGLGGAAGDDDGGGSGAAPAPGLGDGCLDMIRRLREQAQKHIEVAKAQPDAWKAEHTPVEEEELEERDRSYLSVEQDQGKFVDGWLGVVKAFVRDESRTEYECPKGLTGYDRKMLHQLAESFNLGHQSFGVGPQRKLILKKDKLFHQHAASAPSREKVRELAAWENMRKGFNPESARIHRGAAPVQAAGEYEPEDLITVFRRDADDERERAETMSAKQRVAQLRWLVESGFFSDAVADDAAPEPAAKRVRQAPALPREKKGERAMRDFIESGLAPVTVTVERASATEPVGLILSRRLLVTEVRGVSEDARVPRDMFVNEVDGKDVKTPGDFTKAIQGQARFTLCLWYLRKDGFTVPRLEKQARRAEAALQRAVEAQDAADAEEAVAPGRTVVEMKCLTCETSVLLGQEPEWEGERPRYCSSADCGRVTQWVVERYEADPDSDDGAD